MQTKEIIEGIELFLKQTPTFFITTENRIDSELINYLSKHRRDRVAKVIQSNETGDTFLVEVTCVDCCQVMEGKLSKTKLMEYIFPPRKNARHWRCLQCEHVQETQRREQFDFEDKKQIEATLESWGKVLDPNCAWNEEMTKWERWRFVAKPPTSIEARISQTIKQMPYAEFLRTPYWNAVRSRVLQRDHYKCKVCNKGGKLNVHHSDYSIHGMEHDNLDLLITLCQPCHGHFSSKLKVANQY